MGSGTGLRKDAEKLAAVIAVINGGLYHIGVVAGLTRADTDDIFAPAFGAFLAFCPGYVVFPSHRIAPSLRINGRSAL